MKPSYRAFWSSLALVLILPLSAVQAGSSLEVRVSGSGLSAAEQMEGRLADALYSFAKAPSSLAECPSLQMTAEEERNGFGLVARRRVTLSGSLAEQATLECERWYGGGMGGQGNGASCVYRLDYQMKAPFAGECSDPKNVLFRAIAVSQGLDPRTVLEVRLKSPETNLTCKRAAATAPISCSFNFKNTSMPPHS